MTASNVNEVARRLIREHANGTAAKDPEAWMREASITMARLSGTWAVVTKSGSVITNPTPQERLQHEELK